MMSKLFHWPELGLFILRVFMGLSMALAHGLTKFPPPEKLILGVQSMGFPVPIVFAWLVMASELIGGVFIALGLFTRLSALFLGVTMFVAAFMIHGADPYQKQELALFYLSTCLFFLLNGGGMLSLDRLLRKK